MNIEEMLEFSILLGLENGCKINPDLEDYIGNFYNVTRINERYAKLLDKFLNKYALLTLRNQNN